MYNRELELYRYLYIAMENRNLETSKDIKTIDAYHAVDHRCKEGLPEPRLDLVFCTVNPINIPFRR